MPQNLSGKSGSVKGKTPFLKNFPLSSLFLPAFFRLQDFKPLTGEPPAADSNNSG